MIAARGTRRPIVRPRRAGAVLLVAIGAAVTGLLTFWPYLAPAGPGASGTGSLICLAPR